MFNIKKEPADDETNVSTLTLVKNEPAIIEIEFCSPEVEKSSSSNCGVSPTDCAVTNVKTELLEDATFSKDVGSVGPGCSSYPDSITKQELDIEPTELRPPDIRYTVQPDHHKQQCITEDIPPDHKLPLFEGEQSQPVKYPLSRLSPRGLPLGMCGPNSQQNQRVRILSRPAHTDASKEINLNILPTLPRVPTPKVLQDTAHRNDDDFATSHSHAENVHSKKFQCDYCHKLFSRKSHLLIHMRRHTVEKRFQCQSCGKKCITKATLIVHIRTHTGEKPFECKQCNQRFTYASALSNHRRRYHIVENPLQCKTCEKKFNHASSLLIHMQVHTGEKPYECKYCGKKLRDSSRLKIHVRIHTGEKPYECGSCGKKYRHDSSFLTHIRMHTGEKPFECKICGKSFYQSLTLKRHVEVHNVEKPFPCKSCGKKFRARSTLTSHMRIHTGEKPYQCKSCGKSFKDKSTFTTHTRGHTGEKPFQCKSCSKSFITKSALNAHTRIHTREKPASCKSNIN